MNGNDNPDFRPHLSDGVVAIALLTRIPLPNAAFPTQGTRPAAHAAWAYPLVGLLIGGIAILAAFLALAIGLPPGIAALIALLAGILATGAMHEDGLADCADGFWGGWDPARRLEIMKDSQIGTYGVIALMMSLGLRWIALADLFATDAWIPIVLGAAVASRASMVCVMYALPPARTDGLSRQTGHPPKMAALIAIGFGLGALILGLPANPMLPIVIAAGATIAAALVARAKIGGQTGDVLGATQQGAETAILLACLTAT